MRKARGLSREQLAVSAGLSSRTIVRLEREEGRHPHRATMLVLASALGCRPDALVHNDDGPVGNGAAEKERVRGAPVEG